MSNNDLNEPLCCGNCKHFEDEDITGCGFCKELEAQVYNYESRCNRWKAKEKE